MVRVLWAALFLAPSISAAQQNNFQDTAAAYFNEIRSATAEHKSLWDYDLYAPILLVRPENREIVANVPDSAGLLRKSGAVFTGILPNAVNISNTSVHWSGKDWAMIMLPLPTNRADRLTLLAHELFHRAQPHLGFKSYNPDNNHLDQKEARIYLRLELQALRAAILAHSAAETRKHLADALTFRAYRHLLYPGSDSTENLLDLNEGIAEFTGNMTSGRNRKEMQSHITESIDEFIRNPTFVRSFSYQTIPIYGYLLSGMKRDWNKHITSTTNLTVSFLEGFNIHLESDLKHAAAQAAGQYGGPAITDEENGREARIKKLIAEYRGKFIERPHLDIPLQNMNISFDFRRIMPLGDDGTVYPDGRVTDNWGILTVTNGALMSPGWNKITVSIPTRITDSVASGDGWNLSIEPGFALRRDSLSGNYILRKR